MIPQLHRCAPALTIEFHISIPSDVVTALLLVRATSRYEGFSHWVYETASTLSPEFQAELETLGYFVRWCFLGQDNLIWSLPPTHPVHREFDVFLSHLENTPAVEYRQLALINLQQTVADDMQDTMSEESDSADGLRAQLEIMWAQEVAEYEEGAGQLDIDAVVALFQDPTSLKRRLLSLLLTFWETYYRNELDQTLAQMEQCIAYHRQQEYPSSFREVFRRVTGRNMSPKMRDYVNQHLDQVEQVVFVPSCHLGPYFLFTPNYPLLQVAFNCRTVSGAPVEVAPPAELFPLLKALADETRLQIITLLQDRELYAQEIVEALNLSQPTVSRHLQLLERTEVVRVRRESGMKYYSINREQGRELIAALKPLIAS